MDHQWVIRYVQGPAAQVGPFPDRTAAEAWAQAYSDHLSDMVNQVLTPAARTLMPLEWHVGLLVHPLSLEWW